MPLFPKQTQSFRNQKQSFVNATPKCQKKGKGQILCGVNQGDSPFCISWRKAKPCLKFLKRKQNFLQSGVDLGLVLFYSTRVFFITSSGIAVTYDADILPKSHHLSQHPAVAPPLMLMCTDGVWKIFQCQQPHLLFCCLMICSQPK